MIPERKKVIDDLALRHRNNFIISSCGMISRELYEVHDKPSNFYMMGSMGSALGFGIGLALNIEKPVVVFAGDGETLMSLGSLVLYNKLKLPNLLLYIFDNNEYQSTGGQKTISDAIEFMDLAECGPITVKTSDKPSPRIDMSPKQIAERFYDEVKERL